MEPSKMIGALIISFGVKIETTHDKRPYIRTIGMIVCFFYITTYNIWL